MNSPPDDPLDDPLDHAQGNAHDDAFARQLLSLSPAPITSAGDVSAGKLSIELILYQAGYEAGRQSVSSAARGHRLLAGWLPTLAASLVAAIVTLPIAYRIGQRSQADSRQVSVSGGSVNGGSVNGTNSHRRTAQSQKPSSDASRSLVDQPRSPGDSTELANSDPRPGSLRINDFVGSWRSDRNTLELPMVTQPMGTLTAFQRLSIDSLPQSQWVVPQGDGFVVRQTLAAGDFDKFSVTLGLQVNQR
ncbi:MAG: hypothetical protein KDB00_10385 [Planctomycetales bacterium]|nr:hypothetical protein [Planctomycetales bacterium]